jgi:hypothetical protein
VEEVAVMECCPDILGLVVVDKAAVRTTIPFLLEMQ